MSRPIHSFRFLFLFIILTGNLFSQEYKEVKLETSIEKVTVFLQGAQIIREGTINIPKGKSLLTVESLSPYIDGKSLQVSGEGDFTIISVNHRLDYLDEMKKDKKVDSLQKRLENLDHQIAENKSRLEILKEKESLLDKNKDLSGEKSSPSLDQLKQAINFYDKELSDIKKEAISVHERIKDLKLKKLRIDREIADVKQLKNTGSGKIEIRVQAKNQAKAHFNISYLVSNAGWFPNYDVRAKNVNTPIQLSYKADVYQNTGVDWDNVHLRFSNANPNESGVAPELSTWYLNYPRNTIYTTKITGKPDPSVHSVSGTIISADDGLPLPGVNIMVKGSTVGSISDFDGNYQLTLPNDSKYLIFSYVGMKTQEVPITNTNINIALEADNAVLEEVVVTGLGKSLSGKSAGVQINEAPREAKRIITNAIEQQTTTEFEVKEPYSIKSNAEKLKVDLSKNEIQSEYEYYAAPKLDNDAFLIARITDWGQYNLLEGEANLFFEDAYVGRTILEAGALNDTLALSLGRDQNIVIERKKVEQYSRRRMIGSNKVESREFEIIVLNKKSQPIQLFLNDQIPVASINDIEVEATELSGGKLNERTGEITWKLNLEPGEQKTLKFGYEVKYPKREKLILE